MQSLARRPFLAFLALALPALSHSAGADEAPAVVPAFAPVPAAEVVEADLLFVRRPVIVFADSPNDPAFVRQMQLLERYYPQFEARDVILIIDTDPATPSALRFPSTYILPRRRFSSSSSFSRAIIDTSMPPNFARHL